MHVAASCSHAEGRQCVGGGSTAAPLWRRGEQVQAAAVIPKYTRCIARCVVRVGACQNQAKGGCTTTACLPHRAHAHPRRPILLLRLLNLTPADPPLGGTATIMWAPARLRGRRRRCSCACAAQAAPVEAAPGSAMRLAEGGVCRGARRPPGRAAAWQLLPSTSSTLSPYVCARLPLFKPCPGFGWPTEDTPTGGGGGGGGGGGDGGERASARAPDSAILQRQGCMFAQPPPGGLKRTEQIASWLAEHAQLVCLQAADSLRARPGPTAALSSALFSR